MHEQIASALSWITAAVRHSPYIHVANSYASVSATKSSATTQNIAIQVAELKEIKSDQPCWYPLLPYTVIAKGFPIRPRTHGRGLEIDFANMALLSASMSFAEYGGGLVLEGLRTVLIPMKILPKDDGIQWHLEYKRQTNPPYKRSVPEIFALLAIADWYKPQNSESLSRKRCFLGWAHEINVMIGTQAFSTTEVYCSIALKLSRQYQVARFGIPPPSAIPSRDTFGCDNDILHTLVDEIPSSHLIYDTDQRIGWLLPHLSVLLYLTYRTVSKFADRRDTAFVHAEPSADGAKAAFSALKYLISLGREKSSAQVNLAETIRSLLLVLDKAREQVQLVTAKPGGTEASADLYGVELNEILKYARPINIKSTHVGQPWTKLMQSRNCAGVLFCGVLDQPIVPVSPYMLCSGWRGVPSGRDLLVTTGAVLYEIIQDHNFGPKGAIIGETIALVDHEKFLVQSHTHGETTPVFHEHRLCCVEKSVLDPLLLQSLKPYISSGHVFADASPRNPCSEVLSPISSVIMEVVEHVSKEDDTSLPTVPEDDSSSETSDESETGFSNAGLPVGSITSDESPQIEKEPEQAMQPLSPGPSTTKTWASKASSHDSAYVTDPSPSRQISMTSSTSSDVPRTAKKGHMFSFSRKLVDKGKGPASAKQTRDDKESHDKSAEKFKPLPDRRPVEDAQTRNRSRQDNVESPARSSHFGVTPHDL